MAGKIENGLKDAAVDSRGPAGERDRHWVIAVKRLAHGFDVHVEQCGKGALEQLHLSLVQDPYEERGTQLTRSMQLFDELSGIRTCDGNLARLQTGNGFVDGRCERLSAWI